MTESTDPDLRAHDDPAWIDDIAAAMRSWRQGDVIRPGTTVHVADGSRPGTELGARRDPGTVGPVVAIADGLVVISQTCDIVAKSPTEAPYVLLAALVELDEETAAEAHAGDRPRYVPVPQLGERMFADLDQVTTIEKAALVDREHVRGVAGTAEEAAFGAAVGRRFSRFAIPDDVHRALSKLISRFKKRHDKTASAEGARQREVETIRAAAVPDWASDPMHVHLVFVLPEGHLLSPDDAPAAPSAATDQWFNQATRGPADIAERIDKCDSPTDIAWLWERLVEAWASSCAPHGAVRSITADVVCADEMRVSEFRRTQALDLDYLSDGEASDD